MLIGVPECIPVDTAQSTLTSDICLLHNAVGLLSGDFFI